MGELPEPHGLMLFAEILAVPELALRRNQEVAQILTIDLVQGDD